MAIVSGIQKGFRFLNSRREDTEGWKHCPICAVKRSDNQIITFMVKPDYVIEKYPSANCVPRKGTDVGHLHPNGQKEL